MTQDGHVMTGVPRRSWPSGRCSLTVVIAEDHALMREGLVRIAEQAGCVIAGVAGDAGELLRAVRAHRPDVVIADVALSPRSAMTASARRSSYGRAIRVSAWSSCPNRSRIAT
jgi:DNA-binding NarL/FixJ family response regulator